MEYGLISLKMEDNLNFIEKSGRTHFFFDKMEDNLNDNNCIFWKMETTSNRWQIEDHISLLANGRKYVFLLIEDDLNLFFNGR
jgi:hypothetical protein